MPGSTGLCDSTTAISLTFEKWMGILQLTQARGIFENVMVITTAVELPHGQFSGQDVFNGVANASWIKPSIVKWTQLFASKQSYQKNSVVGLLQT